MKKSLISIVVPVYNVEKHLERCIDSLISQTYKNIEIILVNDGSTDLSGKICDRKSKCDSRIKVIHKINNGVSAARNSGIDMCHGDFVAFVDSDDYVEKNYIKTLYELFDEETDITICNAKYIKSVNEKLNIEENIPIEIKKYSNIELCHRICEFEKGGIGSVCWGKLYRRKLLNSTKFVEGMINEDEVFLHEILYNLRSGKYTTEKLYNYCIYDENSIMRSKYNIKRLDSIKAFEMRIEFYKDRNKDLYEKTVANYLNVIGINYYLVKKYIPNCKKILNELKEKININYKKTTNMRFGFIWKIRLLMIKYTPLLYGLFMDVLKRRTGGKL